MTDPEIPTPPGEMFRRTQRRVRQIRRRRLSVLAAGAAAVGATAVAVPLALGGSSTRLDVIGSSSSTAAPAPATTVPVPTSVPPLPATMIPVPSTAPAPAATAPVSLPATTGPGTTVSPTTLPAPTAPLQTPKAATCATDHLSGRLTGQNGTAGGVASTLVVTNTGSSVCTLYGYPGVSYVDAHGNLVGAPAIRSPRSVQTVTLAPGGAAGAPLLETDPHNYPQPGCQLTAFTGLRVYPPGDRASLIIPQPGDTCANPADNVLQVGPMQSG